MPIKFIILAQNTPLTSRLTWVTAYLTFPFKYLHIYLKVVFPKWKHLFLPLSMTPIPQHFHYLSNSSNQKPSDHS